MNERTNEKKCVPSSEQERFQKLSSDDDDGCGICRFALESNLTGKISSLATLTQSIHANFVHNFYTTCTKNMFALHPPVPSTPRTLSSKLTLEKGKGKETKWIVSASHAFALLLLLIPGFASVFIAVVCIVIVLHMNCWVHISFILQTKDLPQPAFVC